MVEQQLEIPFSLVDSARFEHYVCGENAWIVEALQRWASGQADERFCVCWGAWGSGRTHLLNAVCHDVLLKTYRVFYLNCSNASQYGPDILEDLQTHDVVCLDDVDQIFGQPAWESALFHLYNEMIVLGHGRLLLSVSMAPDRIAVKLPDLRSRLVSGWIFPLQSLSEVNLKMALIQRAHQRGFELTAQASQYILTHLSRCEHCVFGYLDVLDRSSLRAQRRVTVPFVKQQYDAFQKCVSCQRADPAVMS